MCDPFHYLFEWYLDISRGLTRVRDWQCSMIPWSEFIAWSNVSGHEVTKQEFALLRAMDVAYKDEMDKELEAAHARMIEKAKRNKG